MEIENNITTEEFIEKCINKEIQQIYVTGYTEIKNGMNFFEPMHWYYYIEFENFFICIESNDSKGMLFYLHEEIQCHFEEIFENEEIFTITSVDEEDYSSQKITDYDLYFSNFDKCLWALGIQFKDTNRFHHPTDKYVFFNALTWDGISFGYKHDRDYYYEDDKRVHLVKFPIA